MFLDGKNSWRAIAVKQLVREILANLLNTFHSVLLEVYMLGGRAVYSFAIEALVRRYVYNSPNLPKFSHVWYWKHLTRHSIITVLPMYFSWLSQVKVVRHVEDRGVKKWMHASPYSVLNDNWYTVCVYILCVCIFIQDARTLNAKTIYCGHNAVVEVCMM